MNNLRQIPAPGSHVTATRGDILDFALTVSHDFKGQAALRTNLGNAHIRRKAIIAHVEEDAPLLARDWHDIPMQRADDSRFSLSIPLTEVGSFEAKTFALPDGNTEPAWPEGHNMLIKVEPAEYCCANTIYTAFVRQFGPNKCQWSSSRRDAENVKELEACGYSVIPRSGTFRDLIGELDFIIGKLRCRIVQLLPIHPIPTTYARMGRFGSPFAALDFTDVDPALTEFDRRTTPMEQFGELVDAVHARSGRLFIDIPVNHTGWASKLQIDRPEWFARGADRTFESPGAWGVTWEDLARLDYSHRGLWQHMAGVFLFWCRCGVDGFRCDAGYMIPLPVWEYVTSKVRQQYPDTIFILENLGGKHETLVNLLSKADLNWAYSELFQNYDRTQIEAYLPGCIEVSKNEGTLVHFAETHDNNRLAATSRTYARMRTALAALCSEKGAFGITNGVEWFAEEKIDVHEARPLQWGNAANQVDQVARLNCILETHPCFRPDTETRLIQKGHANSIVLLRKNIDSVLLVVVNLDCENACETRWKTGDSDKTEFIDLLTGNSIKVKTDGDEAVCPLKPGQVFCLANDPVSLDAVEKAIAQRPGMTVHAEEQCLKAMVLDAYRVLKPNADVSSLDIRDLVGQLAADPRQFCCLLSGNDMPPVTAWQWPRDVRRTVMLPPGDLLWITAPHPFAAELKYRDVVLNGQRGVRGKDGTCFALMPPLPAPPENREYTLCMTVYEPESCLRREIPLLYLSPKSNPPVITSLTKEETRRLDSYAVCTNGRGAMAQVRGMWGEIRSQYDALLAANLDERVPVDRRVMLTRCRAWVVNQGYSQALDSTCLERFGRTEEGSVTWDFVAPAGQGKDINMKVSLNMTPDRNAVRMEFNRPESEPGPEHLPDDQPVKLILRPDTEDRINHEKTKAYAGPEHRWPGTVEPCENGFSFSPAGTHRLETRLTGGKFVPEPEWRYMVAHPFDAERGMEGSSDLFSPGYFVANLKGGTSAVLHAAVTTREETVKIPPADSFPREQKKRGPLRFQEALRSAVSQFVVRRDDSKTVIAGYPWFLDWGRDTLICLRGLIAAGMIEESRDILKQFARFEKNGTLPNMIRGNDDSNRDTSDAPLWFFTACSDLMARTSESLLEEDCSGRSLRDILFSLAEHYISGTPNGIRMDPDSGLIYSPPHFTWMDTNYPAGTPRAGYPVEIQALWHAALHLLSKIDPPGGWQNRAARVKESVLKLFLRKDSAFLSDCLHASPGQGAAEAVPDDHLRPNQLLAITLGAVEDKSVCAMILNSCEELLVPGAIRSLADRPVEYLLPIENRGKNLNDPARPYWGTYAGDEDARRKPAYHNGTAWTWLFPSYPEAMFITQGRPGTRRRALAILNSGTDLLKTGCLGQIPEILAGDTPHPQRGCGAQAWGVTESYRVLAILRDKQ